MENGFGPRVPVKVGEELDVTIDAVGEKGDGIAKKEGFVLFVPNTKENQRVRIKVTKVLRRVGFAEVVGEASAASAAPTAEPEPIPEDSEDFGEEPKEESDNLNETNESDVKADDELVEETSEDSTADVEEDEEKKE